MHIKIAALFGNADLLGKRNFKRRAVPLFFHGDGAPVTGVGKSWGKSCDIFNWGSLLSHGTTIEIVFLIWLCWQDAAIPDITKPRFWRIVKWSFDALFEGCWPFADCLGNVYDATSPEGRKAGLPLVGTAIAATSCFFGVIWRINRDLDFHQKDLIPYVSTLWYKGHEICPVFIYI